MLKEWVSQRKDSCLAGTTAPRRSILLQLTDNPTSAERPNDNSPAVRVTRKVKCSIADASDSKVYNLSKLGPMLVTNEFEWVEWVRMSNSRFQRIGLIYCWLCWCSQRNLRNVLVVIISWNYSSQLKPWWLNNQIWASCAGSSHPVCLKQYLGLQLSGWIGLVARNYYNSFVLELSGKHLRKSVTVRKSIFE
jgi:hypothetical protein